MGNCWRPPPYQTNGEEVLYRGWWPLSLGSGLAPSPLIKNE